MRLENIYKRKKGYKMGSRERKQGKRELGALRTGLHTHTHIGFDLELYQLLRRVCVRDFDFRCRRRRRRLKNKDEI